MSRKCMFCNEERKPRIKEIPKPQIHKILRTMGVRAKDCVITIDNIKIYHTSYIYSSKLNDIQRLMGFNECCIDIRETDNGYLLILGFMESRVW